MNETGGLVGDKKQKKNDMIREIEGKNEGIKMGLRSGQIDRANLFMSWTTHDDHTPSENGMNL